MKANAISRAPILRLVVLARVNPNTVRQQTRYISLRGMVPLCKSTYLEGSTKMAKSKIPAAKTAAATAPKSAPAAAPVKEEKVSLAKMRGPRGVAETAKITLLVTENPKRTGSKASAVFSLYKSGQTVGQFCDAVNATSNEGAATPNLVYDAKHGFIAIEGYDPGEIVKREPKAPKADKAPKESLAKKSGGKAAPKATSKKDAEAAEETMD